MYTYFPLCTAPCISKCGSQSSSISGNLAEMQMLRPHPRPTGAEALGWGPAPCTVAGPPGHSDTHSNFCSASWRHWRTTEHPKNVPLVVPEIPPLGITVSASIVERGLTWVSDSRPKELGKILKDKGFQQSSCQPKACHCYLATVAMAEDVDSTLSDYPIFLGNIWMCLWIIYLIPTMFKYSVNQTLHVCKCNLASFTNLQP